MFNLETREQRHRIGIQLDLVHIGRHHVRHELPRLLEDRGFVDQQFADIGREVIANGANHQTGFLIDQERAGLAFGGAVDGGPELQQVVQVPLQFFDTAADAGGATDQAHAGGHFQLCQGVAQFVALFAFDPARHTTTARIVRHQYQITAGQADLVGQRGALVATLVFLNLDDQFKTFLEHVLHATTAEIALFGAGNGGAGNFLERQKTMPVGAVIDKAGFEGRLDARNNGFVDIALALFLVGGLNVEVDQFLAFDNGDAELLRLRRVEQHTFHVSPQRSRAPGDKPRRTILEIGTDNSGNAVQGIRRRD